MFCQECGGKHRDTAKFCPHCGTKIEPMIDEIKANEPVIAEETVVERKIAEIAADEVVEQPFLPDPVEEEKPVERPLFYNESIAGRESVAEEEPVSHEIQTDASEINADMDEIAPELESAQDRDKYILWRTLIGENDDYYIAEFEAIVQGEPSFNWTAFFFGGVLMLHRRMYAAFLKYYAPLILFMCTGCFVLMFGFSALEPGFITVGSVLCGLIVFYWFLISLAVGHSFNRNYFKHLQRVIKQNNLLKIPKDKLQAISYYGGTTVIPVVTVFVGTILLLLLIQYIGISMGAEVLRNFGL
jgi:hypothetical protein